MCLSSSLHVGLNALLCSVATALCMWVWNTRPRNVWLTAFWYLLSVHPLLLYPSHLRLTFSISTLGKRHVMFDLFAWANDLWSHLFCYRYQHYVSKSYCLYIFFFMKCHLILSRMTIITKRENRKGQWGCRDKWKLTFWARIQISEDITENRIEVAQKSTNGYTLQSNYPASGCMAEVDENSLSKRRLSSLWCSSP